MAKQGEKRSGEAHLFAAGGIELTLVDGSVLEDELVDELKTKRLGRDFELLEQRVVREEELGRA